MDGGQAFFTKTFRASLFNDDLSNEPNLGRILDSTFKVHCNIFSGADIYMIDIPSSHLAASSLRRPPSP